MELISHALLFCFVEGQSSKVSFVESLQRYQNQSGRDSNYRESRLLFQEMTLNTNQME